MSILDALKKLIAKRGGTPSGSNIAEVINNYANDPAPSGGSDVTLIESEIVEPYPGGPCHITNADQIYAALLDMQENPVKAFDYRLHLTFNSLGDDRFAHFAGFGSCGSSGQAGKPYVYPGFMCLFNTGSSGNAGISSVNAVFAYDPELWVYTNEIEYIELPWESAFFRISDIQSDGTAPLHYHD